MIVMEAHYFCDNCKEEVKITERFYMENWQVINIWRLGEIANYSLDTFCSLKCMKERIKEDLESERLDLEKASKNIEDLIKAIGQV